jgi:hypothetical protein
VGATRFEAIIRPGGCALITTFNCMFDRVAMHSVRRQLVSEQAERTRLPLWPIDLPWPCSNSDYDAIMTQVWRRALAHDVDAVAFGDLFLEDIRAYREKQLEGTGLQPLFPICGLPIPDLARDMIRGGIKAKLTCVDPRKLNPLHAGTEFGSRSLGVVSQLPDEVGKKDQERKRSTAPQPLAEKRAGSFQNDAADDARDQERHRELGHHAEANHGSQRQPPALISGLQQANGHPRRQHPAQIVEGNLMEQVSETHNGSGGRRPRGYQLRRSSSADFASHQTGQHHGDSDRQRAEQAQTYHRPAQSVIDTRARKGVIGGYTTYPQLRNRASSIVASSSRWNPYRPLVAVCSATNAIADRTSTPVSVAMILRQNGV